MGVNSLITWAVIDPIMRAVITKTQGSFVVETQVRASRLAVEVTLELHVWLKRELQVLRQALCETRASGSAFRYCIDD